MSLDLLGRQEPTCKMTPDDDQTTATPNGNPATAKDNVTLRLHDKIGHRTKG